jgi:hypothetical protein
MLASEQRAQRPILSGPVYDVTASLMAAVHNRKPIADQVATADAQPVAEQGATAETQDSTGPEPTVPIAVDNMWPEAGYMLLGFYEDRNGNFGAFAEDRTRVLGPRQGHVVLSGLPGAGKTSLFLTLVTSLYAQLRGLAQEGADE